MPDEYTEITVETNDGLSAVPLNGKQRRNIGVFHVAPEPVESDIEITLQADGDVLVLPIVGRWPTILRVQGAGLTMDQIYAILESFIPDDAKSPIDKESPLRWYYRTWVSNHEVQPEQIKEIVNALSMHLLGRPLAMSLPSLVLSPTAELDGSDV